ncbi:hypothetical protein BGZ82_004164, partial [Podila clonocystis]
MTNQLNPNLGHGLGEATGPSDRHTQTHNNNQLRERILVTPRKFHPGEDPLRWIEDFEVIAKGNNWIGISKLNTVGVYLAGTAQQWFSTNHHKWKTFKAFNEDFETRYLTHTLQAKALKLAQEYRQESDQSVDEVIMDLDRLFRSAKIEGSELNLSFLLAALRSRTRRVVLHAKCSSYEEACKFAIEEGDVQQADEAHDTSDSTVNANMNVGHLTRLVEDLTTRLMETNALVRKMQTDRYAPAPVDRINYANATSETQKERFQRLMGEGRCLRCEEVGHMIKDCQSEKPPRPQTVPVAANNRYKPQEERRPNPYLRRQGPPNTRDILETNLLEDSCDFEDE